MRAYLDDFCRRLLLRFLSIQMMSALAVTAPATVRLVANLLSVGAIPPLDAAAYAPSWCESSTVARYSAPHSVRLGLGRTWDLGCARPQNRVESNRAEPSERYQVEQVVVVWRRYLMINAVHMYLFESREFINHKSRLSVALRRVMRQITLHSIDLSVYTERVSTNLGDSSLTVVREEGKNIISISDTRLAQFIYI